MNKELLIAQLNKAIEQINQIIVGKSEVIELAIISLLARGHLLFEDLPGSGKTTLAKTIAVSLGLDFQRIQFTSDLLPADVVGFSSLDVQKQELVFHAGAVFSQILLADEINRASPKSQSALLEAMEERQVTIERQSRALPEPFFVIATQNPMDQVGTYALPESQLDRFLMRLSLGYPSAKWEVSILKGGSRDDLLKNISPQFSAEKILQLQREVENITVAEALAQYVQKILNFTRVKFAHGLSTRAGMGLIRAAKAAALLSGDTAVLPEHIQKVFAPIANHRLPISGDSFEARAENLAEVLNQVEIPI